MRRSLTVVGILGLVGCGLVALAVGWPRGGDSTGTPPEPLATRQAHAADRTPASSSSGPVVEVHNLAGTSGPLVVPGCRLVVIERQEVPSLRDGQLLFLATEPQPGEFIPPDRQVKMDVRAAVTPIKPGEKVDPSEVITLPDSPGKQYRRVKEAETLDPAEVRTVSLPMVLRRLKVGDKVKKGQLVALVDPRLALDDIGVKCARVEASKAEREAAEKTRDEAARRYENALRLYNSAAGRVAAKEEVDGAKLSWDRYFFEEVSKRQAIRLAEHELKQAQTILDMHSIRSKIDGVIKATYKQDGEAVKNLEPILLVMNPNRLRVEGLVDLQYARYLSEGMPVTIEPSKPEKPEVVLRGHLQEVTSVAVCGERPLILSGSEDRTVRVWDREGRQLYTLRFPAAVRAVAAGFDGKENLGLAGTADGSAWLLRGFDPTTPPTLVGLDGRHKGPILSAAFSPDGKILATGGEDHLIRLWNTADGKLLYLCPPEQGHRGGVTALHFASNTELVSAGRGDLSIRVWKLNPNGPPSCTAELPRRSGDVADLGVSPDGKYVLFDQGRDLQVLSLEGKKVGQIEGVLHNSSPAMSFTTMALFSPKDGKLLLTASASENRLQLYRTPIDNRRGAEIRQLMWPAAPATCGAFDPNGRFLVTGMKDRSVLIWQMPSPKEVDEPLQAKLTMVDPSLDSGARQVRIAAEVDNPGYLVPGDTATLVIEAKK